MSEEMRKLISRKAQQEMVGFVLIVLIVMVGLLVFLVISLRSGGEISDSAEVENMLEVLMRKTTECAITFEPQYDNYEDLFKSCYDGDYCSNLGENSCNYLNESIRDDLNEVMDTEATISAYQLKAYYLGENFDNSEEVVRDNIVNVGEGNCTGELRGAQRMISVRGGGSIRIEMIICKGN